MKPVLLDLFCGAGGCSMGYYRAGFDVVGIDNRPQPRYPFEFVQADALEYLATADLSRYAVIHASPPCQSYSMCQRIRGNEHPDLVAPVRELLRASSKPYVIENVKGAPLLNPITLVGSMFGLRTMRPRLFECSFDVPFVLAPPAAAKHAKMGRLARQGEYMHIAGKGGQRGVKEQWANAMGIDWMTVRELAQAIPPAYCEWIGQHLMEAICEVTH